MKTSNIYCVGRNYASHAKELGNPIPDEPVFFQKSSVCLSDNPIITLPAGREIDHELEIVVAIGKEGSNIQTEKAMEHVEALCLGLDLTDRSLQRYLKEQGLPWFLAKSFPGSAVITSFEPVDMAAWDRDFWLRKNGEIAQQGNSGDMIFGIPFLIEYLSARLPLIKGDLIYTGTPSGVGPINDGDGLVLGLGEEVKGRFEVQAAPTPEP